MRHAQPNWSSITFGIVLLSLWFTAIVLLIAYGGPAKP